MSLGGQGAPLVPWGDRVLFYQYDACLNLGGFANITIRKPFCAFDICAVNTVLNLLSKKLGASYDDKGKWARKGAFIPSLFKELEGLSFYKKSPPKSLGMEWVESTILPILKNYPVIEDVLHTYVSHISKKIKESFPEKGNVLVTGGGVFNDFLLEKINTQKHLQLKKPSDKIINYKEALIFGFLGILKLRKETNCSYKITGAKKSHSSGVVFSY